MFKKFAAVAPSIALWSTESVREIILESFVFSLTISNLLCTAPIARIDNEDEIYRTADEKYDAIILAVAHRDYHDLKVENLKKDKDSIIYDVKGILDRKIVDERL